MGAGLSSRSGEEDGELGAGRAVAPPTWARPLEAIGVCCYRPNLRRTAAIAAVVGSLLVAINQTGQLIHGDIHPALVARILLDYLIPFLVSNAGVLSGSRRKTTSG